MAKVQFYMFKCDIYDIIIKRSDNFWRIDFKNV